MSLVTGAGSGIGRAIACALGREGGVVTIAGRRAEALQETRSLIEEAGGTAIPHPVDLMSDGQIDRLVSAVGAAVDGRLDVLVHAAGAYEAGPVEDTSLASLDELYRCNLRAPFALTRSLLALLRNANGDVVFVNSSAGVAARTGIGAYSASKAALRSLADALRHEVNPDGIRVLSVFPGRTATPLQERIMAGEGVPYRPGSLLQPDDIAQSVLAALRLPSTAEVTEIHIRAAQPT